MNKEKEIKEMAKVIATAECYEDKIAEKLVNAGYGNVKQAVKSFASALKQRACAVRNSTFDLRLVVDVKTIDDLITELYGGEE